MVKRKGIISKLLLALVLLTVISCCFLGFTFARYTSGVSGSASVGVAKWDIEFSDGTNALSDNFTVSFSRLSPSKEAYDASKVRSNDTGLKLVAKITNNSEVGAQITLTVGDGVTVAKDDTAYDTTYTEEAVKGLFGIEYTVSDTELAAFPETAVTSLDLAQDGVAYVYAKATWTSADSADYNGDGLDTWAGQHVTSVSWNIACTAVQSTELPTA